MAQQQNFAPYFTAIYTTAAKVRPEGANALDHEWRILWMQLETLEREVTTMQRNTEILIQQCVALLKQV